MKAGTVVDRRYRLERRLGRGGMGEVWHARDLRLNRDVAVKLMLAVDPDKAEERLFFREAETAGRLQHPGITVVHDFGRHDDRLFIVMEFLRGQDLGEILADNKDGLPIDQVLDFGIQLTDALATAHNQGIVHRDLKPSNLFIQTDSHLKVCDFGLARNVNTKASFTIGHFIGTPEYMAPEYWRGPTSSKSVDLYAVGCILYEMLTGSPPFDGEDLPSLMDQHLKDAPVPPIERRCDVPPGLSHLAITLLAKEPRQRPTNAIAVLSALTQLRDGYLGEATEQKAILSSASLIACTSPTVDSLTVFAMDDEGRVQSCTYARDEDSFREEDEEDTLEERWAWSEWHCLPSIPGHEMCRLRAGSRPDRSDWVAFVVSDGLVHAMASDEQEWRVEFRSDLYGKK